MTDFIPECFGKQSYPTQAKAERRIKLQAGRHRNVSGKRGGVTAKKGPWAHCVLMTYRCKVCGQWHVGQGNR